MIRALGAACANYNSKNFLTFTPPYSSKVLVVTSLGTLRIFESAPTSSRVIFHALPATFQTGSREETRDSS